MPAGDVTMTWAGVGSVHLRLALRRPGFRGLLAANAVVGAVGAMFRTALDGLSPGVGVLGGAGGGFGAAVTAWPLLAALSAAALLSDRPSRRVAEAMVTCGVSLRRQAFSQTGTAILTSLLATVAAVPAGAVAGLGDAVRQHGAYLGSRAAGPSLLPTLGVAGYLVTLFAALAVAVRTAPRLFGTLVVSVVAFLAVLSTAGLYYPALRVVCAASPWGPLWSAAYEMPNLRFSLPMSRIERAAVITCWLAVASAALSWGTRPQRGR